MIIVTEAVSGTAGDWAETAPLVNIEIIRGMNRRRIFIGSIFDKTIKKSNKNEFLR
jgi:hypothetical protein